MTGLAVLAGLTGHAEKQMAFVKYIKPNTADDLDGLDGFDGIDGSRRSGCGVREMCTNPILWTTLTGLTVFGFHMLLGVGVGWGGEGWGDASGRSNNKRNCICLEVSPRKIPKTIPSPCHSWLQLFDDVLNCFSTICLIFVVCCESLGKTV